MRAAKDPELKEIKDDIRFGYLSMKTIEKLMSRFDHNMDYDPNEFFSSRKVSFLTAKKDLRDVMNNLILSKYCVENNKDIQIVLACDKDVITQEPLTYQSSLAKENSGGFTFPLALPLVTGARYMLLINLRDKDDIYSDESVNEYEKLLPQDIKPNGMMVQLMDIINPIPEKSSGTSSSSYTTMSLTSITNEIIKEEKAKLRKMGVFKQVLDNVNEETNTNVKERINGLKKDFVKLAIDKKIQASGNDWQENSKIINELTIYVRQYRDEWEDDLDHKCQYLNDPKIREEYRKKMLSIGPVTFPLSAFSRRNKINFSDQSNQIIERLQIPVQLGSAVTTHKSQGQTYDKAYIYLDKSFFESGQGYVALSRTRTLMNIHLVAFDPRAIFLSNKLKKIMINLYQRDIIPDKKSSVKILEKLKNFQLKSQKLALLEKYILTELLMCKLFQREDIIKFIEEELVMIPRVNQHSVLEDKIIDINEFDSIEKANTDNYFSKIIYIREERKQFLTRKFLHSDKTLQISIINKI